jgi:dihydropteroate synthase
MGILNITPDSFSDGMKYYGESEAAVERALEMEVEGADIIDIGGESTRPGAESVTASEELKRVIPVIASLRGKLKIPISIDSTKSLVVREALEAGASVINDISGLRFEPGLAGLAADYNVPIILMHIKGDPRTMQENPVYGDVVSEVCRGLRESVRLALARGVAAEQIIVDPGIGFGKMVGHNLMLIKEIGKICELGFPVMVGPSRKSFIGRILDVGVDQRLEGTAAAAALAIYGGASIIRVHDVLSMVRVARMTDAILNCAG